MEFENIFPTIIGKSQLKCPDDLYNTWINYIINLEKNEGKIRSNKITNDNLTKEERLLDHYIFRDLKFLILKEVKKYVNKIDVPLEDFFISNSWGYVIGKDNDDGNYHRHDNSFISGVFYLTDGAPIEFINPFNTTQIIKWAADIQENPSYFHRISPFKGLLILFPSSLVHRVTKHIEDNSRVCIAFNIFPKGYFGTSYGNFEL
jgi:uncharacterized protein (TIGR02466 family)